MRLLSFTSDSFGKTFRKIMERMILATFRRKKRIVAVSEIGLPLRSRVNFTSINQAVTRKGIPRKERNREIFSIKRGFSTGVST